MNLKINHFFLLFLVSKHNGQTLNLHLSQCKAFCVIGVVQISQKASSLDLKSYLSLST